MNNTLIIHAIGSIDDELIERAAPKNKKRTTSKSNTAKKRKPLWSKWAVPAAACLVLAVAIILPLSISNGKNGGDFNSAQTGENINSAQTNESINLILSGGVTITHLDEPPAITSSISLVHLTEEELFADWAGMERVIFEGIVKKIDNIAISFGSEGYRDHLLAIAHIEAGVVYSGKIEQGEIVTVLLPAPVGRSDIWVEDSSVSSQMTEGTKGIFLPVRYNENSIWEENGNTLYLQEIVEFGMLDGERHAFLDKPDGVVFMRDAYISIPDYENVKGAPTMDEIRQYVISMLERYR